MGIGLRGGTLCVLAIIFSNSAMAQSNEVEILRAALNELRQDYESRIAALEQRLTQAEQHTIAAQQLMPAALPVSRSSGSGAAFNPAIGIIFQGQAWSHSKDTGSHSIQGFPLGGEAGLFDEGLAIGETEINISANVDDKFSAKLTLPVVIEDGESGIEIEEAWIETTALPAGMSSRFGRFFSGIGYLNNKHAHTWDFADQPLPYQAFLGDQYLDDGVQLRWIAPTELYLEFGAEIFRGSRFPASGAQHSGYGSKSFFLNIGGDVGSDHSWLAGVSHLRSNAADRPSGNEESPLLFSGDAETTIAHLVWKWAPNGNWKQRNLVLQSELFWNSEQGLYVLPGLASHNYDNDQSGWYAQAAFQPFPRWRFGARIDSLSKDNTEAAFVGTALESPADDPLRYSLMADWSNSEFSRLRLQYSRDESGLIHFDQWGLQYIFSIGAHGGHNF